MEEVIALEKEIMAALVDDKVPPAALASAHDILCNVQPPGTRLTRLRAIVADIRSANA